MQQEQRENMPDGACNGFEERWTLFTAGELDASEVAEMKSHLVECEPCNQTLAQENALVALLSSNRREPDAASWQDAEPAWKTRWIGKRNMGGYGARLARCCRLTGFPRHRRGARLFYC